jgi:hypothetical protein
MTEKQKRLEGWVSVYRTSTDYEADMVRDRLDSAGIPAAVFTQRDHAFNVNVGALAKVWVMVPPEREVEARAVLEEQLSDEELEEASSSSSTTEDQPSGDTEEPLDSGIEQIRFDTPDEPPEEDRLA